MSEEEIDGVQDLATPHESEQAQEPVAEEQPSQPIQNDADRNWSEARRKMRELEKIAEKQQELIEKLTASKPPEDDLSGLADDDIVTARQAKALAKKLAREAAEEVSRKQEAASFEMKLRMEYPDLDAVLSEENIDKLKKNDPRVAEAISRIPDQYSQAIMAYSAIKNTVLQSSEKQKALANAKKPVAAQAVAKQASPIGNAHMFENGLTPELKKYLYEEMMQAAKGI